MKLLKFRAWDAKNQRMIYVEQLDYCLDGKPVVCRSIDGNGTPPFYNLGELPIMQYIGTNDINGVPIYENDILKVGDEFAPVIYDENNVCYTLKSDFDFNPCLGRYEVIGNTYKNK